MDEPKRGRFRFLAAASVLQSLTARKSKVDRVELSSQVLEYSPQLEL